MKTHIIIITIWPNKGRGGSVHGGFCKGAYQLCKATEQLGSLNAAAKSLGMAYSKAWTLIADIESDFGKKLLDKKGANGSTLTKACKKLMAQYEKEIEKCSKL